MFAHYKCVAHLAHLVSIEESCEKNHEEGLDMCGHEFYGAPGPIQPGWMRTDENTMCEKCGSLYVKWMNYNEMNI